MGMPRLGGAGADALTPALESQAHVVITGRVADPSLYVAPLRHRFGWSSLILGLEIEI